MLFYFCISKKEKAEVDIRNSKDTIKELERNIEKLKKDEQQMKTDLQNIRQSLTEKRTAYAETTGRSKPIEFILKFKDSGKIRGILGRCVSTFIHSYNLKYGCFKLN